MSELPADEPIAVGSTLYLLNHNKRVYRDDQERPTRSPNFRRMFEAVKVDGETRVSWVAKTFGYRTVKINKRTLQFDGDVGIGYSNQAYTPAGMERACYVQATRHKIAAAVSKHGDNAEVLRLLGEALDRAGVAWREA